MTKENFCTKLVFEGMEIDVSRRMLYRGKKEVKVTSVEFQILHLLARNPGRVFSKEQIYDIVWKEPYSGDYNIVMSHIRNIRKKIEDDPSKQCTYRQYGELGIALIKFKQWSVKIIQITAYFSFFDTQEVFTRYMKKFLQGQLLHNPVQNVFLVRYEVQ